MIYTIVRKDDNDNVDAVISFDSIASMDENWSSTVTSQTVEYGFNITDNINIESPTYSITALISSYSLFNKDREIVWDGNDFVSKGTPNPLSHVVARDAIIEVFKDCRLVTLLESAANSNDSDLGQKYLQLKTHHFKEHENCIITSLSISHPESGTGAFIVSMTLQKIVMAEIEVKELVGDEKRALIKPLMKVYTPTTSSSKTEKEDDLSSISSGKAEEELEDDTTVKGNFDEMNEKRRRALGIYSLDQKHEAEVEVRRLMETTERPYKVVPYGGGFRIVEGLSDKNLPKYGGGGGSW